MQSINPSVLADPSMVRAWRRLPSGGRLDLVNPAPDAWGDRDLAVLLSRVFRWGGESCWPQQLSVAQHSLLVLQIRRMTAPEALTPQQELREILHDAEEAFLGFDCLHPLKAALGAPFGAVCKKLTDVIAERYKLINWNASEFAEHKSADLIAAASEALHCVGWSVHEIRNDLGIKAPILHEDPLAEVYGGTAWEPWPSNLAESRFSAELVAILSKRKAM